MTALATTERDLDAQVAIIKDQMVEGAIALHRLGVAFHAINDSQAWKTRTDKSGASKYRSFKHFIAEEIGLSPAHAYRSMAVAKEFKESDLVGLSGRQVRVMMAPAPNQVPAPPPTPPTAISSAALKALGHGLRRVVGVSGKKRTGSFSYVDGTSETEGHFVSKFTRGGFGTPATIEVIHFPPAKWSAAAERRHGALTKSLAGQFETIDLAAKLLSNTA